MLNLPLSWNVIFILAATLFLTLLISDVVSTSSEPQRYPYILPKCCERNGNQPPDGSSKTSAEGHIGSCNEEGSNILILPKEFFPAMSNDLDFVEVEIQSLTEVLDCDERRDTSLIAVIHTEYGYTFSSDILVDPQTLPTLTKTKVGNNTVFDEFAFSRDNLLSPDGNIYGPHHYCISSGTTNETTLDLKICKRKCSRESPCIPRCCGGHQSIPISSPAASNASMLGFCSTPTLWERNPWNPVKSKMILVNYRSHFYQKRYIPHIQGDLKHSPQPKSCVLTRVTESLFQGVPRFVLLEDGRLVILFAANLDFSEDYCIDGINGEEDRSSPGSFEDTCEPPKNEEIVIIYVCGTDSTTKTKSLGDQKGTPENEEGVISLPGCSCLTRPPDKLLQLPKGLFQGRENQTRELVPVRLKTGENEARLHCAHGHVDVTLDYDITKEISLADESLILNGSSFDKSQFCVRSVFHDSMGLRICEKKENPDLDWFYVIIYIVVGVFVVTSFIISFLLYVLTAVVYILRKDKDLVFRCCIVCSSISMAFQYFIIPFGLIPGYQSSFSKLYFTVGIQSFLIWHASLWMSVLCFDIWLNIVFLSTGKKSLKRLWGYIAFTITLPALIVAYKLSENIMDPRGVPSSVLWYLLHTLIGGLFCINILLFLTTTIKLWIAKRSSDIKNQKNTFLLYVKLFLLVGFHSLLDFFFVFSSKLNEDNYLVLSLLIVFLLLKLTHPIVLFILLVRDSESNRYLETNYARVKRTLDFICLIAYPMRKCFGLFRCCKQRQEQIGPGDIELPHCSTHMYVHKGGAPNIPK